MANRQGYFHPRHVPSGHWEIKFVFATLLRTNVFQVFGDCEIQDKKTVESVEANIEISCGKSAKAH